MKLEVRRNDRDRRYELVSDDGELIALIDYRVHDSRMDMFHAETNPAHGGQGYGSMLVKGALDDVRAHGDLTVKPSCPFIADFFEKNPEYRDLL